MERGGLRTTKGFGAKGGRHGDGSPVLHLPLEL